MSPNSRATSSSRAVVSTSSTTALKRRGLFITFEGIDGCGKSTQIRLFRRYLSGKGVKTLLTREPGGTPVAEAIREIVLNPAHRRMDARTELLLYLAARAQHVSERILPALEQDRTVLCDRFSDATIAYQAGGRTLDPLSIRSINRFATRGVTPDLTFVFDLPVGTALKRMKIAGKKSDRMEKGGARFMERVRKSYLALAKKEGRRIVVVDASGSREDIHRMVVEQFEKKSGGNR